MNIFQIGSTPIGYFYQRLSKIINKFSKHTSRYYSNAFKWRDSPYFDPEYIDLSEKNLKEEIINLVSKSDLIIFHQIKNYSRKIKCIDGEFDVHDYIKKKRVVIFIHGQPSTLRENIYESNKFIDTHKRGIVFFVTTPNQINIFKNVKLFPIVGLFESDNQLYVPRPKYLKIRQPAILRCSDWKAEMFNTYLMSRLLSPSPDLASKFKRLAQYYFPFFKQKFDGVVQGKINGSFVLYANFTKVRRHKIILNQIKNTDILLENDIFDYPGGGTTHTIGLEALAMGVAVVNGALKANIEELANWLDADRLPPFPNWDNEKDFHLHHIDYLNKLIRDKNYLVDVKKESRKYFTQYLSAEKIIPKFLKLLEN